MKPGDRVKRGDIIAVVETEKGAFDTECYEAGVIEKLLVESGEQGPRRVRCSRSCVAKAPLRLQPLQPPGPPRNAHAPLIVAPVPTPAPAHVSSSPLARKIAAELGVDLTTVKGSGPGGAIERADVEQAAVAMKTEPLAPAAAPAEARESSRPACAARSPPRWRDRTAISPTIISRRAST